MTHAPKIDWTAEQDALLTEMWLLDYGPHDIGRALGATINQIKDRKNRLRLPKRSSGFKPSRFLAEADAPKRAVEAAPVVTPPDHVAVASNGVSIPRVRFLEGAPL